MSQQDILDLCKANPDTWYTSNDFCEELSSSLGVVNNALRKLRRTGWLEFKESKASRGTKNVFVYKHKPDEAVPFEETNEDENEETNEDENIDGLGIETL